MSAPMADGEFVGGHPHPIQFVEWSWPSAFIGDASRYANSLHPLLGVTVPKLGRGDQQTYLTAVDVPGCLGVTAVSVAFYDVPPYETYGLLPENYPRVWADLGRPSKHRMPDDSLCLYHPQDPVHQQWYWSLGLPVLLKIVSDHLFKERHWRASERREWLGLEAPHALPTNEGRTV